MLGTEGGIYRRARTCSCAGCDAGSPLTRVLFCALIIMLVVIFASLSFGIVSYVGARMIIEDGHALLIKERRELLQTFMHISFSKVSNVVRDNETSVVLASGFLELTHVTLSLNLSVSPLVKALNASEIFLSATLLHRGTNTGERVILAAPPLTLSPFAVTHFDTTTTMDSPSRDQRQQLLDSLRSAVLAADAVGLVVHTSSADLLNFQIHP